MAYVVERTTKTGETRYTGYYRLPIANAITTKQTLYDGTQQETISLKPVYKSAGTFDTHGQALKVAEDEEKQSASALGSSPAFRATATVLEFLPLFFHWHRKELNTLDGYEYLLKRFIVPAFGNARVSEIEHSDLQNFLIYLEDEQNVPPSTIKHTRAALSALFRVARKHSFRSDNPAEGLSVPTVIPQDQTAWDAEIFNLFVNHLPNTPAKIFAKLQVSAGLRIGEMCALRRQHIIRNADGSGTIKVSSVVIEVDSKSERNKNKARLVEKDRTKTSRTRRVRIGTSVMQMLTTYMDRYQIDDVDLLFPARLVSPGAVHYRKKMTEEEKLQDCLKQPVPTSKSGVVYEHGSVGAYVNGKCRGALCRANFTAYSARKKAERQGRDYQQGRKAHRAENAPEHLSPDTWSRIFSKAFKASDITPSFKIPAKNLRHTHAVMCLKAGMNGMEVARRMGHTTEILITHYVIFTLGQDVLEALMLDDLGIDFAA